MFSHSSMNVTKMCNIIEILGWRNVNCAGAAMSPGMPDDSGEAHLLELNYRMVSGNNEVNSCSTKMCLSVTWSDVTWIRHRGIAADMSLWRHTMSIKLFEFKTRTRREELDAKWDDLKDRSPTAIHNNNVVVITCSKCGTYTLQNLVMSITWGHTNKALNSLISVAVAEHSRNPIPCIYHSLSKILQVENTTWLCIPLMLNLGSIKGKSIFLIQYSWNDRNITVVFALLLNNSISLNIGLAQKHMSLF